MKSNSKHLALIMALLMCLSLAACGDGGGSSDVTFARVDADVSGLTEDTDEGKELAGRIEDLKELLKAYRSGLLKERVR